MRELAALGLAQEKTTASSTGKSTVSYFSVSAEGFKMMSDAMRRNGQKAKAWNEQHSGEAGRGTPAAAPSPAAPTTTSTPSEDSDT